MKNKILLVDGDTKIRETLISLLSMDFECVPLQNRKEGLAYLRNSTEQIDLIIVDLDEIRQDDYELLKCIQNHYLYKKIPILVETTIQRTEEIAEAIEKGVDDVIVKPFNLDIVRQRIYNIVDIGKNRAVHNVMEDLIQSEIDHNIDMLEICPCPNCRKDLLTLTLNNVKPKYVSTEKGEAFIRAGRLASMNDRLSLLAEITRYAKLVGDNPHHHG